MADYLNRHKKNILKEETISKSKLESGTIAFFKYSGKNVTNSRPLVLVLNSNWKGKLHGLALDNIPENVLKELTSMVRQTKTDRASQLLKMRMPFAKADIRYPYRYYHTRLKPFLKSRLRTGPQEAYRTYNTRGISTVKLVDYRFTS